MFLKEALACPRISSDIKMVEAAGIETCAAATKTSFFQVLTLQKPGVRVECSAPRNALPHSCFSSSPYFLLTSSYVG
jgi:hypothetical protein